MIRVLGAATPLAELVCCCGRALRPRRPCEGTRRPFNVSLCADTRHRSSCYSSRASPLLIPQLQLILAVLSTRPAETRARPALSLLQLSSHPTTMLRRISLALPRDQAIGTSTVVRTYATPAKAGTKQKAQKSSGPRGSRGQEGAADARVDLIKKVRLRVSLLSYNAELT